MRTFFTFVIFGVLIALSSCRNDFEFEPSTGGLEFSKDTVYLDTVFTNIGSSTYRLKVYNRSDKDIQIPKVQLAKGTTSKYRIMVDGMTGDTGAQGKIFSNVELLAKDSLFIFIEVTADVASANPTDFLYTDQIQFIHSNGEVQKVELVTLIQDAYFIYPNRTQNPDQTYTYENINLGIDDSNQSVTIVGSKLIHNDPVNGDEFIWNNNKPYVVYGYALVPDNEELVVEAGARINFHANSGLIIAKNGKLTIDGQAPTNGNIEDLSKEVIFEGDRLEPSFSDIPGQWGAVINFSTRTDNSINHLTLKNATVGILSNNLALLNDNSVTKLTIKNSQIYNCSNIGILARKAQILGDNLVINYCGEASLACTYGGDYNFNFCTFNNNWSSSNQVAVVLNDYFETETAYIINSLSANFTNSMIYGTNNIEIFLDKKGSSFNTSFSHCLVKFNDANSSLVSNTLYDIFRENNTFNNKRNLDPKFKNVSKNQFKLLSGSAAIGIGVFNSLVPKDILGNNRPATNPTLGAYEFTN